MWTHAPFFFGLIVGIFLTVLILAIAGNWYEYHILVSGEHPITMVNDRGWEVVEWYRTEQMDVWYLRRHRFQIH